VRVINPYMAAANRSPDLFKSRAMAARKARHEVERVEYLQAIHKYEMTVGGVRTGEFKEMTGLEAKMLNLNLRQDFSDEVGRVFPAKVTVRMGRWVLAKGGNP
jgi:hypothetical protein